MKREILAIALFLASLLPFKYFIPLALILLGFLKLEKEWKILPVVSILTFTVSFFLDYTRENAVLLTLILPLILVKYDRLVSSILFSLSVAFLPFGTEDYIILFLTSILLAGIDYRGTIISGIFLFIISAFGYPYSNLAYFYLVFGVISAVLQDKIVIKKEYYLSLGAVLFPLLYHYTIPSILLSLGFGMFFPFSIVLSAIMFFIEGVKDGLWLIPTIILPYVFKRWRSVISFSLISAGLSWFSVIFPPLLLFLFLVYRIEKRSLMISSILLLLLSVYFTLSGIYNVLLYSTIASIISSAVLISSFNSRRVKISHNLILPGIIGIVVVSSILSIIEYNYTFAYLALLTSSIYFSYVSYKRNFSQFLLLIVLSFISRYPFISLSGYRLKDEVNIAVITVTLMIAIFHTSLVYSLVALSASLAYLMQNFRIPRIFSYIPPVAIIFSLDLTRVLLSLLVVISGYLIGRKVYFIGLIYEISLAFSLLYILKLI